jgi:hypothetical protein
MDWRLFGRNPPKPKASSREDKHGNDANEKKRVRTSTLIITILIVFVFRGLRVA